MAATKSDPSWILRMWSSKGHFDDYVREPANYSWPESEGEHHILQFSDGVRFCSISFTELPNFPTLMRVRSTNWRVIETLPVENTGLCFQHETRRLMLAGMTKAK